MIAAGAEVLAKEGAVVESHRQVSRGLSNSSRPWMRKKIEFKERYEANWNCVGLIWPNLALNPINSWPLTIDCWFWPKKISWTTYLFGHGALNASEMTFFMIMMHMWFDFFHVYIRSEGQLSFNARLRSMIARTTKRFSYYDLKLEPFTIGIELILVVILAKVIA